MSASDIIGHVQIEPLTGVDDWTAWKVQMEDFLFGLDLWGYVDGTMKKPTPKDASKETVEERAARTEWEKKDQSALIMIRMRVSKTLISLVMRCTTSTDAWKRLEKNFELKGILRVVQVRGKLLQARYGESDDMEEFLCSMVNLRETLTCLDQLLTEAEFSITLLTALPESWDVFVSSINHQNDLTDSDEIMSRIRQHASRINDPETSLIARAKQNSGCFQCRKQGHQKRDCPDRKKGKGKGKGGKDDRKKDGKGKKEEPKAMVATETPGDALDTASNYAWTATDNPDMALVMIEADGWIADTGTTVHVARRFADFSDYRETPGGTLNGAGSTEILGRGTVFLEFEAEGRKTIVELRDVVHAPGCPHNLLSIGRMETGGHKVEVASGTMRIINAKGRAYAIGRRAGNLYQMRANVIKRKLADVTYAANVARPVQKPTYDQWHQILTHMGMKAVIAMKKQGLVLGMEVDESVPPSDQCEDCVRGKQMVAPYPKRSETEVLDIGDLTVMDLWGKAPVTGINGEKYFSTFTDVKGRRTVTEFAKDKTSELELEHFKAYQAYVKNVHGKSLKRVRCDNGGEYLSKEFKAYLRSEGITLETTTPNSSAQNGIAERVNRTVMDRAMTLLIAANLPKNLWPEAVAYVTYVKNRSPTRALKGKTPHEVWTGQKPDVSALQEWGIKCWVPTDRKKRTKLDPKSQPMYFMGIAEGTKGWRYYDPRARKIGKSRNLIFCCTQARITR